MAHGMHDEAKMGARKDHESTGTGNRTSAALSGERVELPLQKVYSTASPESQWALTVGTFALLWVAGTWLALYTEFGTWLPRPAWSPSLDPRTRCALEAILLP